MSEQCNSPGELHVAQRSRRLSLPLPAPRRRPSALARPPDTRIALAFDRKRQPARLARALVIG